MKKIKSIYYNIKYKLSWFNFLGVLNSPLKGLRLSWYFGPITAGTPYFLPRKLVKHNKQSALEAYNRLKPEMQRKYLEKYQTIDGFIEYYCIHMLRYVDVKYLWIDFISWGWKTKYEDFRHEWNPGISIVIFKKQLFIDIIPNTSENLAQDCYWEAYLYYKYRTKGTEKERIIQMFEQYSCTWVGGYGDKEIRTDYYYEILKPKYIELYNEWKEKRPNNTVD